MLTARADIITLMHYGVWKYQKMSHFNFKLYLLYLDSIVDFWRENSNIYAFENNHCSLRSQCCKRKLRACIKYETDEMDGKILWWPENVTNWDFLMNFQTLCCWGFLRNKKAVLFITLLQCFVLRFFRVLKKDDQDVVLWFYNRF